MKRDMDLVRQILIETEKADKPLQGDHFTDSEHTIEQVAYHVELMEHHGLIDANVRVDKFYNVYQCEVVSLTWDGCDYLDAVRENKVWAKTKKVVSESVGSTTIAVLKQVAEKVALNMALNAIGGM